MQFKKTPHAQQVLRQEKNVNQIDTDKSFQETQNQQFRIQYLKNNLDHNGIELKKCKSCSTSTKFRLTCT